MGIETVLSSSGTAGLARLGGSAEVEVAAESVIVVMDAHRNIKGLINALEWALEHVIRPKDTVIVLGLLKHFEKKNSCCFPLHMPRPTEFEFEEEIVKKIEQYKTSLHPIYRQCKRNEVKLAVLLAAGYEPREITVKKAKKLKARWIVLDSHLKREKAFIYGHVGCNVAVMKGKDIATLMISKAHKCVPMPIQPIEINDDHEALTTDKQDQELQDKDLKAPQGKNLSTAAQAAHHNHCWQLLSWRIGYPRAFSYSELQVITNGFSDDNIVMENDVKKVYHGILEETPVLVQDFSRNDEQFWSVLKILSRVRHRNIMNLVGYCCTSDSLFLLCDYRCIATLEMNLLNDESAKRLPWKARWYVALEIGVSLRYLHEECLDGPIVHLSVCSSHIVFSHGFSAMLGNFTTAKCLKEDLISLNEDSPALYPNLAVDECLSIDVHDYGMFLVELITGKTIRSFEANGEGRQSLIDSVLPILENGPLSQVMDPRLMNTTDSRVAYNMARAASLCLKNNSGHRYSISEVLAAVRGDQLALSKK